MNGPAAGGASTGANELWLLDRLATAAQLATIEAAVARLSPDEVSRAASFADRQRARLWSAGRTGLRLLLEARCGIAIRQQAFAHTAAGRPTLDGAGIGFSIADSGPHLLIAITSGDPVGVDIEQPRSLRMTPERLDLVMAAGEGLGGTAVSPLRSWCRIEAFAKAVGPSLAATLARLGVQGHGAGRLTLEDVRTRARQARTDAVVEVADLDLPRDVVGAVAGHGPFPAVRVLDAPLIARLGG